MLGCPFFIRFYCDTRYDLDDHFKWLQPIALNLDLSGTTHLDHERQVRIAQVQELQNHKLKITSLLST